METMFVTAKLMSRPKVKALDYGQCALSTKLNNAGNPMTASGAFRSTRKIPLILAGNKLYHSKKMTPRNQADRHR
jgi:hypothetical protein